MKTCIYARRSTLKQGQSETIENQIKICERKAKELGLTIVDIKTDSASGTDDNNRPEVKELLKGAINKEYDCVIMKGISRIYRKTSKGLELIEKLDRHGVRVITVEEHFDSHARENRNGIGNLDTSRITMYLMFAEKESQKLAERIKFTQIEKAYAGEWNQASNAPIGYTYDSTTKKLSIDNSKSYVVRKIFKLYEQGMGMKAIAHYLNGDNPDKKTYPSSKGGRWSEYTVGYILKNRAYVGDVVYNKRSKKERPYKAPEALGKTSDDICIINDYNKEEDWIIAENAHEPLIERELFNKIQTMISTKSRRKGIRSNTSLFAGIAKCAKCGTGMTFKRGRKNSLGQVVSKDNYYCMNYIRYGKQYCDSHHVGARELQEAIFNDLEYILNSKDELQRVLDKNKSVMSLDEKKAKERTVGIQKEMDSLIKKMDKLLEKNLAGDISDTQYKTFNEKYSAELDNLTEELKKAKLIIANMSEQADNEMRFRQKLSNAIGIRNKTIEEQRHILLGLIDSIVINGNDIEDISYKFERVD